MLEHLEKTSTEHFDYAEHEREHWAQISPEHQARATSTLIIVYNYLTDGTFGYSS